MNGAREGGEDTSRRRNKHGTELPSGTITPAEICEIASRNETGNASAK